MSVVGRVCEIARYPVKSMAGVVLDEAELGWHGLAGDRRLALRRLGDTSNFPWLSASRLPAMVLYQPMGHVQRGPDPLPTHVRTPGGVELAVGSPELDAEVGARLGSPVELMQNKHGAPDEGAVSIIAVSTIAAIGREAGLPLDRRRFRANLVVETEGDDPFVEDTWVGRTLAFGEGPERPAVCVTLRDERCTMLNIDPETGANDPRVMKAAVRLHRNLAGVYATVIRTGVIRAGDRVTLE